VTTTRASTIVIVEESAAVQELIEQALRETGDSVLVTPNPLEVLDVARRERIDLLVVGLGSRTGLVEHIRAIQPDLRVLYLSDGSDEYAPELERDATLLTPFSFEELRTAIADRLDRSHPGTSVVAGTGP
jgi:DNA-binding response OmpR family regulator